MMKYLLSNKFTNFLFVGFSIVLFPLAIQAQTTNTIEQIPVEQNNNTATNLAFENFPYQSNFLELSNGLRMHYLDEGSGDPILLLHGNPTSSFLWRNVIPSLAARGRVIAPDLLNFGLSDQTAPLTFLEQGQQISELIESLNLENITVIAHDWGGPIGLSYAVRNPAQIKGFAFFESPVVPLPNIQSLPSAFVDAFIDPANSRTNIVDNNLFIEGFLFNPAFGAIANSPSEAEKAVYRQPFLEPDAREQILIFPEQLPFLDTTGHPIYDPGGGTPQPVPNIGEFFNYANYLATTDIPRLLIVANPGFAPPELVLGLAATIPGLEIQTVGTAAEPAFHFIPEDAPGPLSGILSTWLDNRVSTSVPESSPLISLLIIGSIGLLSVAKQKM